MIHLLLTVHPKLRKNEKASPFRSRLTATANLWLIAQPIRLQHLRCRILLIQDINDVQSRLVIPLSEGSGHFQFHLSTGGQLNSRPASTFYEAGFLLTMINKLHISQTSSKFLLPVKEKPHKNYKHAQGFFHSVQTQRVSVECSM